MGCAPFHGQAAAAAASAAAVLQLCPTYRLQRLQPLTFPLGLEEDPQ